MRLQHKIGKQEWNQSQENYKNQSQEHQQNQSQEHQQNQLNQQQQIIKQVTNASKPLGNVKIQFSSLI